MKAAEAAIGAGQSGLFWEMHNMIFEHRKQLGTISLKGYAKEVGVNNKKFLSDLMDSVYGWSVRNDLLEGLELGVRDVPAFFINDELVAGKPTIENLRKQINEKLAVAA